MSAELRPDRHGRQRFHIFLLRVQGGEYQQQVLAKRAMKPLHEAPKLLSFNAQPSARLSSTR